MEKNVSAIADCMSFEGVQDEKKYSPEEAVQKIFDIVGENGQGSSDELSPEEYHTIRNCLVSIGTGESEQSDAGSLLGKGQVTHTIEGAGLTVESVTNFQIKAVWEHERHEWSASMGVKKVSGEAMASALNYTFRFISFGTSEENKPIVLFDRLYERKFDDDTSVAIFNNGEFFSASEFDISKHAHWGYLAFAQCTVVSDDAALDL